MSERGWARGGVWQVGAPGAGRWRALPTWGAGGGGGQAAFCPPTPTAPPGPPPGPGRPPPAGPARRGWGDGYVSPPRMAAALAPAVRNFPESAHGARPRRSPGARFPPRLAPGLQPPRAALPPRRPAQPGTGGGAANLGLGR